VIGRSKECDIRVSDPNVSRRHAEIRQEGSTYTIIDLGSTNGISVNGKAQKKAKLEDEDRVTMGSTELVFRRS
jgi:pSer/pThr/pTyr-binding forkhead associated (FHA) protein